MIRFIVSAALFLAAAAVGLIVASLVLDGVSVDVGPFIVVVAIFAALQGVLAPFVMKTVHRNAPALVGAAGLVTTFIALLVTDLVTDGLTIEGATGWVVGTLIVWLASMVAAFVLPLLFVKKAVDQRQDAR